MTLEQLRTSFLTRRRSRFHKSPCPHCGEPITNQAMGRKAHVDAHKRVRVDADAKRTADYLAELASWKAQWERERAEVSHVHSA